MVKAFQVFKEIDWGTQNNVLLGDEVYIYVGPPYQRILFKTEVIEDNVHRDNLIDDSEFEIDHFTVKDKYVRLRLVDEYLHDYAGVLSFGSLQRNGLKSTLQNQQILDKGKLLFSYIKKVEDKKHMIYYSLRDHGYCDLFEISAGAIKGKTLVYNKKVTIIFHIKPGRGSYSQSKFEDDLRALLDKLEVLMDIILPNCNVTITFQTGGNLIIPEFFLSMCARLGIKVRFREDGGEESGYFK